MMKIKRKKSDVWDRIIESRTSIGMLASTLIEQNHPSFLSVGFRFISRLETTPTYHENKSPQAERKAEAL